MNRTNVGIIGCGVISRTYAGDIGRFFPKLRITACVDLETTLAEKLAAEFGIPKACTTAELLSDPEIGLVINLTPPQAHTELNRKIIEAGCICFARNPSHRPRKRHRNCLTWQTGWAFRPAARRILSLRQDCKASDITWMPG